MKVLIPLGVKHRLSNPSKLLLTLMEIQSGSYLEKMILKDLKMITADKFFVIN